MCLPRVASRPPGPTSQILVTGTSCVTNHGHSAGMISAPEQLRARLSVRAPLEDAGRVRSGMRLAARDRLHYAGAIIWILLTVSLASWWMFFGLEEASQLGALGGPEAARLSRV